jgi:hypothetical protein
LGRAELCRLDLVSPHEVELPPRFKNRNSNRVGEVQTSTPRQHEV